MKLKSLTVKNMMSVGEDPLTFRFDEMLGITAVVGENGHGKSVMCDALSFNWFGRPIRKFKTQGGMVNHHVKRAKMMTVSEFEADGKEYRLERGLPGHIKLEEDGRDVTRSVAETNEHVCKVLRMDHALFCCAIVNSTKAKNFFQLDEKDQKGVVESLFGFGLLSEKAEALKHLRLDASRRLDTDSAVLDERQRSNDRVQVQVNNVQQQASDWDRDKKERIARLGQQLRAAEAEIEKLLADVVDPDELDQAERVLTDAASALEVKLRNLGESITLSSQAWSVTRQECIRLQKEIDGLGSDDCPTCRRPWDNVDDLRAARAGANNKLHAARLLESQTDTVLRRLKDERIELQDQLKDAEDQLEDLQGLRHQADSLPAKQERADGIKASAEDLHAVKNPLLETLEGLRSKALEPVDRTEVDRLAVDIEHYKWLENLCSKRDSEVRRKILGEWLPALNGRLDQYLTELDLPQRVGFRDDLVPEITHGGIEMDFGGLSTGQTGRVVLALNWAFRDIFEDMHGRVSFSIVDEQLDNGMDEKGAARAVRRLREMSQDGRSVVVISHRMDVIEAADEVLEVRLVDGFTAVS